MRVHTQILSALDEPKTAYAYKNGHLVHIADVSRGLDCGCVCIVCNNRLIAKKGQVRVHHFSHSAETNCKGAAETALHLLAKELICILPHIILPPYEFQKLKRLRFGLTIKHEARVIKGGLAVISKANSEQPEDGFIPDITLQSNSKILFIEIAVTHKVDRVKLRYIRKRGIPAIEISLDLKDATLNREELLTKLQNDINSKRWLFHPKQREAERQYISKVRNALRRAREPIAKPAISDQKNIPVKSQYQQALPSWETKGLSRAKMDRLYYEYYLKNGRQTYDEDDLNLDYKDSS